MGSTFMLCTVDQESGVHGILVPMSMLCWVVPPRGTTRATVSTGWLNHSAQQPCCLAGHAFLAKARPTAHNCGWRQQGQAAIKYMLQ